MSLGRLSAWGGAAAVLALSLFVATAVPATANEAWTHAIGRASAEAECPTTTDTESAAGWSEWAPSWAQWPNGGAGGYVCERSVVGASGSTPSGIGCVVYGTGEWANFNGNWYLPPNSPAYTSAGCGAVSQNGTFTDYGVYAPPGFDALTLCRLVSPTTVSVTNSFLAPNVYECLTS